MGPLEPEEQMAVEDKHQIPYPIDEDLIRQAQSLGDGKYVHDINCAIGEYRGYARVWTQTWNPQYWSKTEHWERQLRGIVAQAKIGKITCGPWA